MNAIEKFLQSLEVNPEYVDALKGKLREKLDKQLMSQHDDTVTIDVRIANLKDQIRRTVERIATVKSETTIRYMEESIEQIEAEIVALGAERVQAPTQTPNDFNKAFSYFKYYLEHLDLLLLNYPNPIQQARYFGVIFNNAPTFGDIESGTENVDNITGVNSLFRTKTTDQKLHGWG